MSHELTLIVAATRNMGIGAKGGLPWTGLKKEMAYFARVTKRLPPQAPSDARNAVIMGRKTWDSIPPRFRPLKGRLNIVISRSHPASLDSVATDFDKDAVKVSSLDQALAFLRSDAFTGDGAAAGAKLGRVFVIGGAQIYGAALEVPEAKRVLLTRVLGEFECDAFFPLKLGGDDESGGSGEGQWAQVEKKGLDEWVGEEVEGGEIEENETRYEFQMWEKN
ncbi:dihydrofolate reductase-like domain-containing protein [Colletotrichum phormii]|uniref:Dihydrofolate reductase n=1 Tax=Colletotrichum phormii TaxID=359342 RepID=A0AAJ0EIW4_9PEZI|nr:dihydrofolate reductase-like domain-containing protein [Colletotrichum phormii]KAK1640404.1 dihydrofolate reductase-like domain-containing protein [Colletotrichum phormii]